jgi:hypothetical protein
LPQVLADSILRDVLEPAIDDGLEVATTDDAWAGHIRDDKQI